MDDDGGDDDYDFGMDGPLDVPPVDFNEFTEAMSALLSEPDEEGNWSITAVARKSILGFVHGVYAYGMVSLPSERPTLMNISLTVAVPLVTRVRLLFSSRWTLGGSLIVSADAEAVLFSDTLTLNEQEIYRT